ncbi:pentapeptide repeat-containing protein [Trinickia dinghuensis]|uniref:Pentapeptide repeat-containing protein n=1 Tax=Trinickia dinghuensis TaxID=2291023 RepID=A0A3D8JZX0_9BURK|nr:pentapeptide repeat-containing protein [Trinickia dinghuensis]RDU98155.1 hypothetical protein DWV00_12495 [Trinickia dinghuensis]
MSDLVNRAGPLVVGDAAQDFQPRSDLTYRSYARVQASSADLSRSLLIGALFQQCTFSNVRFDNCDIEGARFTDCTFVGCTFIDADLRSCSFARCEFKACSFEQALLLDITVQGGCFSQTSFDRASIHDSAFEQSVLRECSFKHASALQNTFDRTGFEDMRIADCTFLYALMLECRFDRIQLNAEAVGTIFGISKSDLMSITLIYLGDAQCNPAEDIVAALKSSYVDRKWYFLSAMLEVNYGPEHRLLALSHAMGALCAVAASGIGVKRDEFRFLARVTEVLARQNVLPIGFLVHAAEETGRLLDESNLAPNVSATITELHNRLYLLLQQSVDLYSEAIGRLLPTGDETAEASVTVVYRERPAIGTAEVVRLAGQLMSTEAPNATLVSARLGSWIEVVQTTAAGVMALYAVIAATNGILTQIIRTRALANALAQPIPKRTVQALVRTAVLRNNEPMQSRLARSALATLSDMTKRSTGSGAVHQLVAGGLDKLECISVELDKSAKDRA